MSPYLPILAIDTAAQQCAVALLGESFALERSEPQAQGQSQRILPMIQDLLKEAGLTFGDLKAVAVTTGPGSFTGLRIGLAAAHGIALARGIPAIGIDSFTAFNASLPETSQARRAVIIESRRLELYWCLMDASNNHIQQPSNSPPEDIVAHLATRPALLCGDGYLPLRSLLPDYDFIDQSPGPSPFALARLGMTLLASEGPQTLPQAYYIRPPDAKPARQ